jgi:hypothetical protein
MVSAVHVHEQKRGQGQGQVGRGWSRRRLAKVAVVAAGVVAFSGAGFTGALAQDDGVGNVFPSGASGVVAEDLAESIIADVFASNDISVDLGDVFDDDVATGGTGIGGDLNVGGNTGGSVTMGGGSSGGITIGGGSGGTGGGAGTGGGGGAGTGGGGGSGSGSGSGGGMYN